jgi:hypothetical protein
MEQEELPPMLIITVVVDETRVNVTEVAAAN